MKCQCNKNSCADLGSEDSFGKGGRLTGCPFWTDLLAFETKAVLGLRVF